MLHSMKDKIKKTGEAVKETAGTAGKKIKESNMTQTSNIHSQKGKEKNLPKSPRVEEVPFRQPPLKGIPEPGEPPFDEPPIGDPLRCNPAPNGPTRQSPFD